MYYKRIEKKDYFYINAPIALEKSYETLKSKKGVIVSSDDNGEFLLVPTPMVDEFVPTTISRQDLETLGFDASNVTDSTMEYLAEKMEDDYLEQMYWNSLKISAEYLEIPKKDSEEEE